VRVSLPWNEDYPYLEGHEAPAMEFLPPCFAIQKPLTQVIYHDLLMDLLIVIPRQIHCFIFCSPAFLCFIELFLVFFFHLIVSCINN
jgi:hypothetical protein